MLELTKCEGRLKHRFAIITTLLFAVIAGLGFYNHEMWRDELEIFMEMRDAPGFLALFPDIQPLPNVYLSLLYALMKLWPNPAVFQAFHLLVITLAVFIFNKYSPFNHLQKIFFTFSYFVLFEYGIISREYSMLLLFAFLLVYLITRGRQNFILIALAMVILANHHLYGVFISVSIFIYEVFYLAPRVKGLAPEDKKKLRTAGLLLAIASFYIVPQYFLLLKFNRFTGFGQAPYFMTFRSIWNAFFPVPAVTSMHFWNTNIFPFPYAYAKDAATAEFLSAGNIIAAAVSLLILMVNIIIFSRKTPVLIVFLINTVLQLIFLQHLSVFFVRYQGPLFIIFIYSYWLLSHSDENISRVACDKISVSFSKSIFSSIRESALSLVTFVLFTQFCVGVYCYIQDARYPFTASYKAAKYIKEQGLDDNIMVGYIDYVAQAISGHLNQKIFYPQKGDFGTHMVWKDRNRRNAMPLNEVIDSALRLHYENKKNVLLIINGPLFDQQMHPLMYTAINAGTKLRYLNEFTETIVADEQYFLYLIYSDI